MIRIPRCRARPLAGILAVILSFAGIGPVALAGEPPATDTTPTTLAQAVAAKVAAMDPATAAALTVDTAAAQATPAEEETRPRQKPFFKTGKGIAAAALMAGGLAVTFVSFGNDRVKSPSK
jgi:hypothetical protein